MATNFLAVDHDKVNEKKQISPLANITERQSDIGLANN